MPSKAPAQLGEFLEQTSIEMDQHHKDLHWHLLWILEQRLDLLLEILLKVQLVAVGN